MLTTDDYIELVSAGVDAGMISLVEGAYRCLFEATAGDTIPVRPVDYVSIAGNLGIDIADCINDGEPDLRAVERKVTASAEFKKLTEFVDEAIDMGIDYSGLGYRDENGMIKYTYSEFGKNPSIRNAMANMRNGLLNTASGAGGLELDNPVMKEALARRIGYILRFKLGKVVDREARTSVPDILSNDSAERAANVAYISSRHNVEWTYSELLDGGGGKLTSSEDTDIFFDKNGNVFEVLINDDEFSEWANVLECMVYGPINGVAERFISICDETYSGDTWANIVSRTPSGVLVGLLRKIPDMYNMLEHKVHESDSGNLYAMLKGIEILVSAYDSGDVDGDDLTDILNHAGDPGYISNKYGIDLMGHVSKVLGSGSTQFDTRIFSMIPGIAEAITGKKQKSSGSLPGSTWDTLLDIAERDNYWGIEQMERNPDAVSLLHSPEVQQKIYRASGTYRLTSLCRSIAHNMDIFIPIDRSILNSVMRSGYRTYDDMENIVHLYSLYVRLISLLPQRESLRIDSRNVERIFSDVLKYITPRVQRELCFDENGNASEFDASILTTFIRYVPGFRLDPIVGGKLVYTNDEGVKNITTNAFIAAFNMKIMDVSRLVYGSTSPDVLNDVYHKTPAGLRVIDLVTNYLNDRKRLNRAFDDISDYIYDSDETRELAENFLNTYIVPKRAALADAVTEVAKHGGLEQMEHGYGVDTFFGHGLIAIMDRLNEPVGKKPSIASMLFLSRGSWLDFNTKAWEDCKVEGEIWLLMEMVNTVKPWVPLMLVTALGGKNLLNDIGKLDTSLEVRTKLVTSLFREDRLVSEKAPNATPLVSDDEFEQMTRDNPKILLLILDVLSPERKKQAEAICFNPEFMDNLAGTLDGMRLLIELGKMSGLTGFSEQFILSHKNKITEALELMLEMGADQKEIDALRNTMFGSTRGIQQEGGKISDDRLGRVEYSLANGLRWMTGYVKVDTGLSGAGDSCTLFSLAGAMEYIHSLGENSMWRLPTSEELRNLGTPDTVTRLGIGFSPTGKGDSDGEFDDVFDSACYAWYCDKGNYGGYSVSYGMINIDDSDIDAGDYLAIKLVSRA